MSDTPNPRIAAVVLAAGQSSRFGGDKRKAAVAVPPHPNLTDSVTTLLACSVANVLPFAAPVVVVLKPEDQGREASLLGPISTDPKLVIVHSEQALSGMSGSLKDGLAALGSQTVDGLLVVLADMPFVKASTYSALIKQIRDDAIVRPFCQPDAQSPPQPGNPILFGRNWLPALASCEGDAGARHLIQNQPQSVIRVEVNDEGVLRDIDEPSDLLQK